MLSVFTLRVARGALVRGRESGSCFPEALRLAWWLGLGILATRGCPDAVGGEVQLASLWGVAARGRGRKPGPWPRPSRTRGNTLNQVAVLTVPEHWTLKVTELTLGIYVDITVEL